MSDRMDELRSLAAEAAAEAPDPRAKKCWFPWSHEWTLWRLSEDLYGAPALRRRCVRCGLLRFKSRWEI
jgi:hypothetical protein